MRAVLSRRSACLVAAVALLSACGGESHSDGPAGGRSSGPDPEVRARRVAAAWDGSSAAGTWRTGYYPMGEATQPPEGGFRSRADRLAYENHDFTLRAELPALPRAKGRVSWGAGGGALTLPLLTARKAYEAVNPTSGTGRTLTVTGVRLGAMTLTTSRGPATVPAWLFSLEGYGYDKPLKRVAVRPSVLPARPIGPEDTVSSLSTELIEVSGDGRAVTVRVWHGACDDGPVVDVLETDGSVVLTTSVRGENDGPCIASMQGKEVTVRLAAPVGDRVLLDASTGIPLPYGSRSGSSPSWRWRRS